MSTGFETLLDEIRKCSSLSSASTKFKALKYQRDATSMALQRGNALILNRYAGQHYPDALKKSNTRGSAISFVQNQDGFSLRRAHVSVD